MSKQRKQLDTDILLSIAAQLNVSNILTLSGRSMSHSDRKACESSIEHFTDSISKLTTRSRELDKSGL